MAKSDKISNNSSKFVLNDLKRKLIQFTAALIYNADIRHWFNGTISQTKLKKICVPGLNCYSCPGAIASCPLGALQTTLAYAFCYEGSAFEWQNSVFCDGIFFVSWNFIGKNGLFVFVSFWTFSGITL